MSGLPRYRIIDTYKPYKVRERKFTGWLKETGEKLGLVFPKRADDSASPAVRINDIRSIVQSIISRGQMIPEDIRQVLRDVISQRKEARAFYRPQGKADGDHAHYIAVLEDALKAFEPSNNSSSVTPIRVPSALPQGKKHVESSNLFDQLDVMIVNNEQETASASDSDDHAGDDKENHVSRAKTGKRKSGKRKGEARKTRKQEKSLEKTRPSNDMKLLNTIIRNRNTDFEDETDDLYFMVYCFFKDCMTFVNIFRNDGVITRMVR